MEIKLIAILAIFCVALAFGAGCLQQNLPPGNTNQTCTAGSCPVPTISSFEQCVQAGYPVMESYPRQCRVPGGNTFTENLPQTCQQAGGHWNECSNRCQLDNQGNPNAVCTLMCESLCECSGIAGFKCPNGYTCRTPPNVPDALGYCIPEGSENRSMTREQAYAHAQDGMCVKEGNLTGNAYYNPNSRTWWIDLEPFNPNPLCNPACVIAENGSAEINGRCTGLVPPRNDDVINNITCRSMDGSAMSLRMALQLAGAGDCAKAGSLTDRHVCNEGTGTWWIDIEPSTPMRGCNPACVVQISTQESEVNWRCTGLLP